jgi:hypothetical protein
VKAEPSHVHASDMLALSPAGSSIFIVKKVAVLMALRRIFISDSASVRALPQNVPHQFSKN